MFNSSIEVHGVPDTLDELPALPLNSEGLSTTLRLTARTYRNHLKLLVDLGVITKKFRGNKANFDVRVTSKWLTNPFGDNLDKWYITSTPIPQFAKTSRKNFPLIDLRETKEDIDIDIGKNVDNISKLVGNFQGNSGYVVQGVARKQPNDDFLCPKKMRGLPEICPTMWVTE